MITWSNAAPPEPKGPALPIRRTPAFKPLVAIVTSEDLVGCYTHFFKGHTVPCENPDCEACTSGIPYRWHSYLAALDFHTALHFIFECTAQATEMFTAYRDAHKTLRGCLFQARRLNQRPNGRVLLQTKPADLTERKLPQAPDLTHCLAILWSLPLPQVQTPKRDPEKRAPAIRIDRELPDTDNGKPKPVRFTTLADVIKRPDQPPPAA